MNHSTDPKKDTTQPVKNVERSEEEIRQQQTDPNITELKGFIDPNEDLEPKGTDNDFGERE